MSELAIPLRECTPWCDTGNGHANEHPDDRNCWSTSECIPLSRTEHRPLRMVDGTWVRDYLTVYLVRRPNEDDPHVLIHREDIDTEIRLTFDEAEELSGILRQLLVTARVKT